MARAVLIVVAILLAAPAVAAADPLPTISVSDAQVREDGGAVAFVVTLSSPSATPVSFDAETVDGTAVDGQDYTGGAGTIDVPAGETAVEIDVPVLDDQVIEPDETFALKLSNPSGATLADDTGVGTIVNDDTAISVADVTTVEANSGTRNIAVPISLAATVPFDVAVSWHTADGTATAGSDYSASSGRVVIPAGTSTRVVFIPVQGDTTYEDSETFSVVLDNPDGAPITRGTATVTIRNDDAPPKTITAADLTPKLVSIQDARVVEGTGAGGVAVFPVLLSAPATSPVTVAYTVSAGTADGADVQLGDGSVTIPPGAAATTISAPVTGDRLREADEQFHVTLTGTTAGARLFRSAATGTIVDDDRFCTVPSLKGHTLASVRRRLAAGHCTLGAVHRRRVAHVRAGHVATASARAGRVLADGASVTVVVSTWRKTHH